MRLSKLAGIFLSIFVEALDEFALHLRRKITKGLPDTPEDSSK